MPTRAFAATNSYRYGFNGQERSTEIHDNSYTAEFWEYDSRLGRRWNLDPRPNPAISPYATFANNPISFSDLLGDTTSYSVQKGDNLTNIAKQHNVSLDRLKQYNPQISDPNKISIGQNINIPGAQNSKLMDGDFVGVVNAPNGAGGYGHNALIVGNDNTGWTFISKEGRQEGEKSGKDNNPFSGGVALPPKIAQFGTLQDLYESDNYKEYKRAAIYSIESSQTKPLIAKMTQQASSKYVLLASNCGHSCGLSMKTVGLDPGWSKSGSIRDRWGQTSEQWIMSPMPNVQFEEQIRNNRSRLVGQINE